MSSNENAQLPKGASASGAVVKLEPTDSVLLPFSNAHNRENISQSLTAAHVITSRQKPIKTESIVVEADPDVVKMEDIVKKEERSAVGIASASANHAIFKSPDEISYNPEDFLKEGVKMVKSIKSHVKRLEIGSKLRKDVWLREIASLETQGSPSTMIAVCGATGAGKSSALNAILDDNIVPTSGMRACTAVITEISYHKEKTIEADVSFLSEKEWRDELEVLLEDLLDEDGQVRRTTDLRSEAGVAWHKVHALYPTLSHERLAMIARRDSRERVDAILKINTNIMRFLGTTKKIVTGNSKDFAKEISKYIDSKDQKRGEKDKDKKKDDSGAALWPLIRLVNVRCNSAALSTGAVLVDLPGVADANAARSNIAKDYMKKADCVWILAPITRAVDDKTAKDLLGDAFKSQLMNGGFANVESTITFIATKCDDISCTEVIGSLGLDDDPSLEEIEERLSEVKRDMREWKQKKSVVERTAKDITEELELIRSDLAESQEHLKALEEGKTFTPSQDTKGAKKRKNSRDGKRGSAKRRRENFDADEEMETALDPDADANEDLDDFIDDESVKSANFDDDDEEEEDDDDDNDKEDSSNDNENSNKSGNESDDSVQENDQDALGIEDVKAVIEQKKSDLKSARERLSGARKERKEAMDMISNLTKKQNKAQKDKNAFCSLKRSDFSRDVLKEDFRSGLKELDDAAEEKRNPMGFDPSVNLRDYNSINLPVFTISSRDYIRIRKQVKGDGESSCFTNIDNTGVPELQRWCHTLTIKSRERSARSFRNQLRVFAKSVMNYIHNVGKVSEADKEALRQKWESTPELGIYTMNDDDEEEDGEGEGDWVYQRGRLIPVARTRARSPELGSSAKTRGHAKVNGITGKLSQEFGHVIAASVGGMQGTFKDGLEEKCQEGANAAAEAALESSDAFAASMHWATYRATLRRMGVWRRNLNEELISPMTKSIATSWAKTFENNLFSIFEEKTMDVITKLLKEVEESCPIGLRDRAQQQGKLCLEEVKVALRKTIDVVSEELTSGQKDVSRSIEPHVREQLSDGYCRAMEECGKGSVARQKLVFRNFVASNKDDLFEDGTDVIFEGLDKVAIGIGNALEDAMDNLAEKIEVNLAVLWEEAGDSLYLAREREEAVGCIDTILGQLTLWDAADKARNLLTIKA